MTENLIPKFCQFSLCGAELMKSNTIYQVLNGGECVFLYCPKCHDFITHRNKEWIE